MIFYSYRGQNTKSASWGSPKDHLAAAKSSSSPIGASSGGTMTSSSFFEDCAKRMA